MNQLVQRLPAAILIHEMRLSYRAFWNRRCSDDRYISALNLNVGVYKINDLLFHNCLSVVIKSI